MRRVEEVHSREAIATLDRARELRDRNRRGVGSEDGLLTAKQVGLREEIPLEIEVLGYRFDDQVSLANGGLEIAGKSDSFGCRVGSGGIDFPLLDPVAQRRLDVRSGGIQRVRLDVVNDGFVTRHRGEIRDAAAHRARADHGDLTNHRRGLYDEVKEDAMGMGKEFKEFASKGNVIELAIAVVIGGAFGKIVTSFVEDILTPLLGAAIGKHDLSDYFVTLSPGHYESLAQAKAAGAATLNYGVFLNTVINFVIVALAIFLFVHQLIKMMRKPAEKATRDCPQCLSPIPEKARRCKFCTQPVATPSASPA